MGGKMAVEFGGTGGLMAWFRSPLMAFFLVALPFQAAPAGVIEEQRYGPTCNASTRACQLKVKIIGEITVADFDDVKRLVDQTRREAQRHNLEFDPPYLKLDSPGGDVTAAMAIGRLLRKEQAFAHIEPEAICYSACVLVLAGATGRNMQGRVGIHRPYLEVPKEVVSPDNIRDLFQKMLQDIRSYFREMNVSEQLADAMLRISPENMRLLNSVALNGYGLTDEDPIARETMELNVAQQHGLSRQEYMRRKALAKSWCVGETTVCYRKIIETGKVDPQVSRDAVDFSEFGRPAIDPSR